ncbi:MAG: hypothetical protein WKG00_16350 [Polyangiaceae bacterium]
MRAALWLLVVAAAIFWLVRLPPVRRRRAGRAAFLFVMEAVLGPLWVIGGVWVGVGQLSARNASTVLALLLAFLPLLVPWALTRRLLVPLGLPRAAWWVASTPDGNWKRDPTGGPALAAAWALCVRGNPELIAWVEARLCPLQPGSTRPEPLRGAGMAAHALFAAARGDDETARALFAGVLALDRGAVPAAARKVTIDWLVADAAERGAWVEVAAHGRLRGASATARFLAAVGERLLGRPTGPAWRLWAAWAWGGPHFATLPLLRQALGAPAAPQEGDKGDRATTEQDGSPASEHGETPPPDVWQAALVRHARASRAEPSRIDLLATAAAWDRAFAEPGARRRVDERAIALGATRGAAAWPAMQRQVERDRADAARLAGASLRPLQDAGGVAARAAAVLRDELLGELELAGTALRARVDQGRALAPVDEWREHRALAEAYRRAVSIGGEELRRLAFSKLKNEIWGHAYWLSNTRGQPTLAHAMYAWLRAEAEAVGDTRAIDSLAKNVEATKLDPS